MVRRGDDVDDRRAGVRWRRREFEHVVVVSAGPLGDVVQQRGLAPSAGTGDERDLAWAQGAEDATGVGTAGGSPGARLAGLVPDRESERGARAQEALARGRGDVDDAHWAHDFTSLRKAPASCGAAGGSAAWAA